MATSACSISCDKIDSSQWRSYSCKDQSSRSDLERDCERIHETGLAGEGSKNKQFNTKMCKFTIYLPFQDAVEEFHILVILNPMHCRNTTQNYPKGDDRKPMGTCANYVTRASYPIFA